MSTIPPYLKKGDKIGIVSPAGYMPVEKMQACIESLDAWGYNVQLGTTTHSNSSNYFSGTDDERLEDLQNMLDDHSVKAVLCARGGYGMSRIIDRISFKRFLKRPKWIIGFSDITVLHAHIYSNFKIASLHAPMAAAFMDGDGDNPYLRSLRDVLEGKPSHYECPAHQMNRNGMVKGQLVGGNLALLAHLSGTRSDIKTKDRILFIEDVGEYLYNIDRMMIQLKRSGKFKKLGGLIVGGFTDSKDTERPFGKSVHDIIYEHIKEYKFPVCFDFPVSHGRENYALKIGMKYHLQVGSDAVSLIDHFA
jgi:muramoyltetrapeptide carboxypeptidase